MMTALILITDIDIHILIALGPHNCKSGPENLNEIL
jgi:hypothetical protein